MVGRTPGAYYPITASTTMPDLEASIVTNNESLDMSNWNNYEFRTFMKWFIEVNHPEVVEQYQAVRAIERKIEQEEANRRYRELLEAEVQLRQRALAQQAQQAYPYSQSPLTTQQKSFWERCKELAKRPLGHGDYY